MTQDTQGRRGVPKLATAALIAGAALCAPSAQAQISRSFIAPHEYALPVDFKPFNIFVEYATLQSGDKAYDAGGDKIKTDKTDTLVGLSKYVRLWSPEGHPKIGIAWEIIVPEVGIRNKTAGTHEGGIGDPITGFALWTKPVKEWTVGGDLFVQVPIGDTAVGGGDRWNVLGSFFWDGQYDKLNYTGDVGYNLPGSPTTGDRLGTIWHTNHRVGYQVTDLVEPYLGVDYEHQASSLAGPSNHDVAGAAGVMFHLYPHASLAVHYEKSFSGESRTQSDNVNVRVVYVF